MRIENGLSSIGGIESSEIEIFKNLK